MAKKLRIKQVRSAIGRLEKQKRTIRALGLGKLEKTVVHNDRPSIRGMIRTVQHLLTVEEIDGE
ncbi:MAG: 50S ribosomal protein L30 [Chitinispirillaceae bacterium]|nr:50S ribosomal protein L30 [Chitinispirillaceae bacterium]